MDIIRKILTSRKGKDNNPTSSSSNAQLFPPEPKRDRRIAPRNAVRLPANMEFGVSGIPEPVYVRDFNEKGVYLISSISVGIGAHVEIFLTMPPEVTGGEPRDMHYVAAVVREEKIGSAGEYGIAAIIKRCELLPPARTKAVRSRRAKIHQPVSQDRARVTITPAIANPAHVRRD